MLIISGFPGIGKSYAYKKLKDKGIRVLDSDSSKFSWVIEESGNKVRHPNFPNNYIGHIKNNMDADIIFVSSHDIVQKALYDNELEFISIYPACNRKEEFMNNYRNRGNDENFLSLMDKNFNKFINDMENSEYPFMKIELGDEYLLDYLLKTGIV